MADGEPKQEQLGLLFPKSKPRPVKSYYQSGAGLVVGRVLPDGTHVQPGLNHIFHRPVELLANSLKLVWDKEARAVKGKGRRVRLQDRYRKFHLLNSHELDALRAEDLLRYWHSQKEPSGSPTKAAKEYFKSLRILEFTRCVIDTLLLGLNSARIKLTSQQSRRVQRFMVFALNKPVLAAQELKRWAGICRAIYFEDAEAPKVPPLFKGLTRYQMLQLSYMGRALPPPPKDESLLPDYVKRLTSEPPPEHPLWRQFCKSYFSEHLPKGPVVYRTDPSVSASLGFTRENGGFTAAVQSLVSLGVALDALYDRCVTRFDDRGSDAFDLFSTPERDFMEFYENKVLGQFADNEDVGKEWSNIVETMCPMPTDFRSARQRVKNEVFYAYTLRLAVHAVLGKVSHIPLLPLYAEEKGLKVRYPATTLAAATLVYQLWRRAIDSHLMTDPKHSSSLGGPIPLPLHSLRRRRRDPEPGYYYSQDLSFATDLHPFWLTRTAYEEVAHHHPRLEEWVEYFPKLFGPHKVLVSPDKTSLIPPVDPLKITTPEVMEAFERPEDESESNLIYVADKVVEFTDDKLDECLSYVGAWAEWLKTITDLPGPVTTTSASMGDSTSFPLMPLLTEFCARQSGIEDFITAGDDAVLAGMTPDKERAFEETVRSCGGVLSRGDPVKGKPNKIYKHKSKFMFCEQTFSTWSGRVRLVPTIHLSMWTAPSGGSKGTIDWFNQPSSIRQHYESQGLPISTSLWRKTKTWWSVNAAYKLGLPVGSTVEFGGIDHPLFPRDRAGPVKHDSTVWLNALSQLNVFELALGTGLSPLPSGVSALSRTATKKALSDLTWSVVGDEKPGEYLQDLSTADHGSVLIQDAADVLMRIVTSWELYHRNPPKTLRTPSIGVAVSKFLRKVRRYPRVGSFEWEPTMVDVAAKKLHYVDESVLTDLIGDQALIRAYGLEPSPVNKVEKARKQWQHLADMRIDRAYAAPKVETSLNPKGP